MARIVVVEDDGDIREVMVLLLLRADHEVIAVNDGAQGLEAVRTHRPDAVVSDIDMPVMDGVEFCCALRADPQTATLPVVFVSGSIMPGDPRPAEAGATAMVSKPFMPKELVACVHKVLALGHDPDREPSVCP